LKPRTRQSVVAETVAVLEHPDFAPLFGPASRAEVPIVAELLPPGGKGPALRLTGQIDRLVRLDTHVLIVDYKTNRPPPTAADAVAEAYLLQLAAYRLAVGRIFSPLPVRTALLWTDGPRIMEIPAAMLDAAEARLFTAAQSRDAA
jgi:ATP-dependent helicase/nuclease subunit A